MSETALITFEWDAPPDAEHYCLVVMPDADGFYPIIKDRIRSTRQVVRVPLRIPLTVSISTWYKNMESEPSPLYHAYVNRW